MSDESSDSETTRAAAVNVEWQRATDLLHRLALRDEPAAVQLVAGVIWALNTLLLAAKR